MQSAKVISQVQNVQGKKKELKDEDLKSAHITLAHLIDR